MRVFAILAALLVLPAVARAQSTVTVTLNDDGRMLAQRLGVTVDELTQQAEDKIDALYKVSRIDQLLRAFANTAAFAQRGLTVDYDIDRGDFLLGATAGGVHGDVAIGTTNSLLGGSVVNGAAMAGANLARWKLPRWTVFAGGYYESMTIHGLAGHLLTLGAHGQFQAVPERRRGHFRWTGVAITSGIEYAKWDVGLEGPLETGFHAQGQTEYASIHISSTGTLDVHTRTYTVPIEVTTGVRAGALTLYGGAALDLATGDSTINARLDGVLSINSDHLPVGTAVIEGTGSSSPSTANVHALVGVGIHTRYVRFYLQGAFAPGETAASIGLRLAYQ